MKTEYSYENKSMEIYESCSEEYNTTYYTYMIQIGAETYLVPIDRTLEEIEYDVNNYTRELEIRIAGVLFNPTIYWVRVDTSDEIKITLLNKESTMEAIKNASIEKLRSADDLRSPMHAAIDAACNKILEEKRRNNMNPLLAWFKEQDAEKEELTIPREFGI